MYTKDDIKKHLAAIGVLPTDTVLVHSSYKAIGDLEDGANTVLDAFSEFLKDGLLIFPTHTWKWLDSDAPFVYTPNMPSCNGYLTEVFRTRPGVVRSLHPTHSVAALGADAESYTAGEETAESPCPPSGCWGKLALRKAKILFLGCPIRYNTFLHFVEEQNKIPDRLSSEPFDLTVTRPDGSTITHPYYRHHSSFGDVSSTYGKMEMPYFQKKLMNFGYIGDAPSFLCDAKGIADLTTEFLRRDPNLFGSHEPVPFEWYR